LKTAFFACKTGLLKKIKKNKKNSKNILTNGNACDIIINVVRESSESSAES